MSGHAGSPPVTRIGKAKVEAGDARRHEKSELYHCSNEAAEQRESGGEADGAKGGDQGEHGRARRRSCRA